MVLRCRHLAEKDSALRFNLELRSSLHIWNILRRLNCGGDHTRRSWSHCGLDLILQFSLHRQNNHCSRHNLSHLGGKSSRKWCVFVLGMWKRSAWKFFNLSSMILNPLKWSKNITLPITPWVVVLTVIIGIMFVKGCSDKIPTICAKKTIVGITVLTQVISVSTLIEKLCLCVLHSIVSSLTPNNSAQEGPWITSAEWLQVMYNRKEIIYQYFTTLL